MCLFTISLLPFTVFFSREIYFAKPTPFHFSLFAAFLSFSFLDRWRQFSLLPRIEITIFSKNIKVNVKLIYTSVRGVSILPIWSRLQIRWRRLTTEDAGVKSDRTTCWAKILERGVIRNTWIRGKKATFLDNGQICLAAVKYMKIIDHQMSGRPIQVNGAFYSIKKIRVIKGINGLFHLT